MEGYRDPFNRLPYPWGKEDTELLDYYKRIGKIRAGEPLYKNGYFEIVECNSDILAFVRYDDKSFAITIINRSEHKYHLDSNIELKSYDTNRAIRVFNPYSAHILKGEIQYSKVVIEFYK